MPARRFVEAALTLAACAALALAVLIVCAVIA